MIFKAIRLNEITQVKCVKTREEAPTLSPDHRPTFEDQGDKEKPAKESRVASKVKRKAGESGVPGNKKSAPRRKTLSPASSAPTGVIWKHDSC